MMWLFVATTGHATVTAFMKAGGTGVTCTGGPTSANFATGGAPVPVLVCVSASVESLCGITYRLQSASGESGRFNILSRTAGSAYGALDGAPTFAQFSIVNPAAGINLGGGTSSNLPVMPANDQLVATLTISPTINATNSTYVLSLDPVSVVGIDDGTGDCSASQDQSITASITFNRAAAPAFTSADSATITVGSAATLAVTASGTPSPTLSMSGTLPSGITFSPATGLLAGTPSLGTVNSYALGFTAANGISPDATQNFTLTVQKANQAVNFGALASRAYSATPFAISATTSSGLPVSFSSSTTATCSVSGTSVTMLITGTCTIMATQAGNSDYNAAGVSQSFTITGPGPHLVTPSAGANGSISPSAPITVSNGATTSLTVTPNNGFSATVGGTCGGSLVGTIFTTNAITADCTVAALFTLKNYVVTGVANPLAGGTINCTSPVNHGSTTSCTVTTNAGYTLTNISGCGGAPGTTSPYTTDAVTGACTVTATYTLNSYVVSSIANPVAAGTVSCTNPVNHGSTTSCAVTTNTGYALTSISGCGGTPGTSSPYTTGAITGTCTVTANYTLNNYVVSGIGSPVAGGTISCTSPVNHGSTASCTVTVNTGYTLTNISGCGGTPGTTSPYNTGTITGACSVTATYTPNSYVVSGIASPVAGGTVSCASPVNHGSTTSCTVTTNAGYTLTNINGCGGTPVTTSPYTTGAITGTCSVTASYTLNSYVVNGIASPLVGGTVNCSSPVNHGSTTSCTVTTNVGYTLTNISGCGGTPGTVSPYTTGAITGACIVSGSFATSFSLVSVVSRKMHNGLGPFEVILDPLIAIGDAIPVEPRSIGAGHLIAFTFSSPITDAGSVTVVDALSATIGTPTLSRSGNEVLVTLTGIPDNKRVTISLSGVNGSTSASASVGFLVGDITGSRSVNASDISTVKAHLNQTAGGSNFRADTNADGVINSKDLSAVKARSGLVLP